MYQNLPSLTSGRSWLTSATMGINPAQMNAFSFEMKLATAFSTVALMMQMLGVVTSSWMRLTSEGRVAQFGLWQGCIYFDSLSERICISYSDLNTTRNCSHASEIYNNESFANSPTCITAETLRNPPWDAEWFEIIRIVEIIGLGGAVLAVFICLASLIYADLREQCTSVVLIVVCFLTVLAIVIPGILLLSTTDQASRETEAKPSWSLDVSIFSSVVALLAGSIIIIDVKAESCVNFHYELT